MRPDKELEWLNDPHRQRPLFIGDLLVNVIVDTAVGAVIGAIGWLALVGLDRIFQIMGI